MKRYNRSNRREKILAYLRRTSSHPAAYEVFDVLKRQYPSISLGTVYRNLATLAEQRKIRRIGCAGGVDRYDARVDDHDHFLCESCGEIYDLESETVGSYYERVRAQSGHDPKGHNLEFYGCCAKCANRQ